VKEGIHATIIILTILNILLETTIGEIGRRIKEKSWLEDELTDQHEHKLSFSSLFFSILSFVSFNLEKFSLLMLSMSE